MRAVCFSPNGKSLLAAMPQNTIKIWDIASQRETMCLTGHQAEIYSLDYVGNLVSVQSARSLNFTPRSSFLTLHISHFSCTCQGQLQPTLVSLSLLIVSLSWRFSFVCVCCADRQW